MWSMNSSRVGKIIFELMIAYDTERFCEYSVILYSINKFQGGYVTSCTRCFSNGRDERDYIVIE